MLLTRLLTVFSLCLFVSIVTAHDHSLETVKPELWQLSPEEIKAKVNKVRAGKDLTPESWPGSNKVAVSLSFDVDTEPVWMGFQKQSSPSYMSRGEYGVRTGMPRILKLLEKHDITATFFIPAMTMELHPEVMKTLKTQLHS